MFLSRKLLESFTRSSLKCSTEEQQLTFKITDYQNPPTGDRDPIIHAYIQYFFRSKNSYKHLPRKLNFLEKIVESD